MVGKVFLKLNTKKLVLPISNKIIQEGMFCNYCHWKFSGLGLISVYQGCYQDNDNFPGIRRKKCSSLLVSFNPSNYTICLHVIFANKMHLMLCFLLFIFGVFYSEDLTDPLLLCQEFCRRIYCLLKRVTMLLP